MNTKSVKKIVEKEVMESYEAMYRLAYTYVKNESDAMDVVQESVYRAIRSSTSLKNIEYCKTWLLKIVINTSITFMKKRDREIVLEYFTDEVVCDNYTDIDLLEQLDNLSEKEKSIIVLRYFEDRKLEEISAILGENINSVKSILYRGLKKLKGKLEEGDI